MTTLRQESSLAIDQIAELANAIQAPILDTPCEELVRCARLVHDLKRTILHLKTMIAELHPQIADFPRLTDPKDQW